MEKVVLVGYGAHARTVADSVEELGKYEIAGYTDLKCCENAKYKYLGSDDNLEEIYRSGIKNAIIAVGQIESPSLRIKLYHKLKEIGYELPVIQDVSAIVSKNVEIGEGTFIGKGAVIETGSKIGVCGIINTCCMISHDGDVGDFCHISGHTNVCGSAKVGDNTFVGAAATIISGKCVGKNCIIGAGTLVIKDVADNMKVMNKIVPVMIENMRES